MPKPPRQYQYGGLARTTLPGDLTTLTWMANENVVLVPDPLSPFGWFELLCILNALLYPAGVLAAAITSRNEDCPGEPGPCFFHYLSHWYYIWFALQFMLCAVAYFSRLVRATLFELHWLNVASAVSWLILTTLLVGTTTAGTVRALLPVDDQEDIGGPLLIVIALHYWPAIFMLIFTARYGEAIAAYWRRRISSLIHGCCAHTGYAFAALLLFFEWWSPALFWMIYLAIYNPYHVYDVDVEFRTQFALAYAVGALVFFLCGLGLGWYLHWKSRQLMARREREYSERLHNKP